MLKGTVPALEMMLKPSDPGLCLGDKISTHICISSKNGLTLQRSFLLRYSDSVEQMSCS